MTMAQCLHFVGLFSSMAAELIAACMAVKLCVTMGYNRVRFLGRREGGN
jgi:hypothetical protein